MDIIGKAFAEIFKDIGKVFGFFFKTAKTFKGQPNDGKSTNNVEAGPKVTYKMGPELPSYRIPPSSNPTQPQNGGAPISFPPTNSSPNVRGNDGPNLTPRRPQ